MNFPSIDLSAVQRLCEPTTISKGEGLVKRGAVQHLLVLGEIVTADVVGTYLYQVQLQTQPRLSGTCSCPAASYQPFCKHAVAVAIMLADGDTDRVVDSDETKIRDYLLALGPEAILETLMGYLSSHPAEWDRMLTKIQLGEERLSYQALKSMVTQALPREHLWDWREVGGYFQEAEAELLIVWESAARLEIEKQWKLINYTVARLNAVLMNMDDSNGDRWGIEALINENMPRILAQLPWSEEEKAQWMFERLTHYEFDVFPSIHEHFADLWRQNPHYLALCREAINSIPDSEEQVWERVMWAKPLIECADNWREVVDIKQTIACRTSDYLQVVELYLEHDALQEAQDWLAKARKQATDYEMRQCDKAQVTWLVKSGEVEQAWQLSNRLFADRPTFQGYQMLAKFKDTYQIRDDTFHPRIEKAFINIYQPPNRYDASNSDALVEYYMDQQHWEKACQWVASRNVSVDMLLALANAIVDQRPHDTLNYYLRSVTVYIEQTNNESYQQALVSLKQLESLLDPYPAVLQLFYHEVNQLAQTYKRKRNMLALLKEHYGQYV